MQSYPASGFRDRDQICHDHFVVIAGRDDHYCTPAGDGPSPQSS
jgi:hypothetical protein